MPHGATWIREVAAGIDPDAQSVGLADPANPGGYVQIDKATMCDTRYGNVFSLGDAGSSPNSKTGAAIRKQAPVWWRTCGPSWPAASGPPPTTATRRAH
jgi:hypothetical protein